MNISKMLVENVLECDIYGDIVIDKNIIKYCTLSEENMFDTFDTREINIYEFAHKCKYWALSKGYYLSSNIHNKGGHCQLFKYDSNVCCECGEIESLEMFNFSCELEAIFKACEWVLKE